MVWFHGPTVHTLRIMFQKQRKRLLDGASRIEGTKKDGRGKGGERKKKEMRDKPLGLLNRAIDNRRGKKSSRGRERKKGEGVKREKKKTLRRMHSRPPIGR